MAPAFKVVAGNDVIVGQIGFQVEILGVPEPSGHGLVGPHPLGPQPPGDLDGVTQQPVADTIEPVVVDAAIHQLAHN